MGPQNRMDFDNIIETINDRLDTLERYQRLHAQSLAYCDEGITNNRKAITATDDDIATYKKFIAGIHGTIDRYVNEQLSLLGATTESFATAMAPRVDSYGH